MRWLAIFLTGCSFTTGPHTPAPARDGSSCEAACANMAKLKCYDERECLSNCGELAADEGSVTGEAPSTSCLEHATSCAQAERCK